MSNLFGTTAPLASEISMFIQLLTFSILIIGFIVVKRNLFKIHGTVMFTAALLNIISVLLYMIPSAIDLADTSIPGFNILFRTHILLGIFIVGLSGYILLDWRFQEPGPTCFQNKKWMLGLALTWTAQIILGILFFMRLYQ
jgi:uncharacterized membrane protein YozB (DUF420 family)